MFLKQVERDYAFYSQLLGNEVERIFPQRGIQTPTEGVDESMHALGALYPTA